MAEAMFVERRVHWGAAVAGAFFAAAIATVLGLFGAAFGRAGITVLSGVWQILTPLVAGFLGAALAAMLAGRSPYLHGGLVWALCVTYVGAVLVIAGSAGRGAGETSAAARMAAGPTGTTLALAGLAAILGLVGALIGSAIGGSLEGRIARRAELRTGAPQRTYAPGYTAGTAASTREPPRTEPPEMRH